MHTSHPSQSTPASSRRRLPWRLLGKIAILGLALLLVACAGMNSASSASTATATSTPAATPTFISTSGNQLVTIVQQSPTPGAVTVNVTEVEFAIMPSITTFRVGVPYYFVVTNKGKQTHALTFVPTYPDGTPMDEYYQFNHMLIGLNTIPPGTTQTINHTFTKADIGYYEMACRMRGHYMAGMHIPVKVVA
jgi:uncharacterized cupredoxin-like copper-binding protein